MEVECNPLPTLDLPPMSSPKLIPQRLKVHKQIVPENQIESLKIICAADVDDIVITSGEVNKFKEGQSVRITEGEFKGVTGKVARYKNHQRVGIIIEGLLTICTAYIPSAFIDIIED